MAYIKHKKSYIMNGNDATRERERYRKNARTIWEKCRNVTFFLKKEAYILKNVTSIKIYMTLKKSEHGMDNAEKVVGKCRLCVGNV